MVTRPSRESIEAMAQAIRPCDLPPKIRTKEEQDECDLENKKRACRLAKQRVRLLCKCIGADHLVTNTYRETMQDLDKLKKDFKEFVRLVRFKYPEWVYVVVFEKRRADQENWSCHLHLAVGGKQDIKWLRRCWLRAIGQSTDEIDAWFIRGEKLGDKSKEAVNVTSPTRRWFGKVGAVWRANNLAAYMTKYIQKEFETVAKGAKKYWYSKGIDKPEIIKFWLGATNFSDANHLVQSSGIRSNLPRCE